MVRALYAIALRQHQPIAKKCQPVIERIACGKDNAKLGGPTPEITDLLPAMGEIGDQSLRVKAIKRPHVVAMHAVASQGLGDGVNLAVKRRQGAEYAVGCERKFSRRQRQSLLQEAAGECVAAAGRPDIGVGGGEVAFQLVAGIGGRPLWFDCARSISVAVDNLEAELRLGQAGPPNLCDRRGGAGAEQVIRVQKDDIADIISS